MEDIIRTEGLCKYFRQKGTVIKAVDGVDVSVKKGKITALVGESGCGKTTIARIILGFYKPDGGKIYYEDTQIHPYRDRSIIKRNVQVVFQNPFLSFDPRYTVFSILYETLSVFRHIKKKKAYPLIEEVLKMVELSGELFNHYPHQLSGGQLQRLSLARALINNPSVVILDEPTTNLDVSTSAKIIALLKNLQDKQLLSYLFISHNLKLVRKIAHYVFVMYNGKIVEFGSCREVYENPLHPYTRLLIEAANYKIKGTLEEKKKSGCVFRGRCNRESKICKDTPLIKEINKEHYVFCHNIE